MVFMLLLVMVFLSSSVSAAPATLIDEWASVPIPAAPPLKSVVIDPQTTAFLILDIQLPMCGAEQRPRCAASVPKIAAFLLDARMRAMPVIYSLTPTGTPENIVPAVSSLPGEPSVRSSVDKFYNTDLEKILKEKGVKTVIIVGTAAHGAVLHTATGAAMRGLQVIIPVDGMSAIEPYAEQYTAWHMLNAPGTRARTTLTTFDRMSF
jgi:nicotinamidase-related amidase